jgi:hypothetical protein
VALAEAALQSPPLDGLADWARRYAAHARRVRAAGIVGLAAALVVGGAVASGVSGDRVPPPPPVTHLSCSMDSPDLPPAPWALSAGWSATVREVLVCADRSPDSVWPGSLPPDEPVSNPADLDYLRFEPRDPTRSCLPAPSGPAYRMLVLGIGGDLAVHDNGPLRCNGWPALERYFIAIGDQLSGRWGTVAGDPFPQCPSILQQDFANAVQGPSGLSKGVTLTQATACYHPLVDPARLPRAALSVVRTVLGARQVADLGADLASKGSTTRPGGAPQCPPLVRGRIVVHVRTTAGTAVTLVQLCAHRAEFAVDWNLTDLVTLSQHSVDLLRGALGSP